MFIFTAKFSKKKAIIAVLLLGILICAAILLAGYFGGGAETASTDTIVKNNNQRVEYLRSFGWEVDPDPVEEQTIVIPKEFSGIYEQYAELQSSQGFALGDYAGLEATRYTYEITNYPEDGARVVADLIVYRNRIIAGDVQSTALDGFMQGLSMPGK